MGGFIYVFETLDVMSSENGIIGAYTVIRNSEEYLGLSEKSKRDLGKVAVGCLVVDVINSSLKCFANDKNVYNI